MSRIKKIKTFGHGRKLRTHISKNTMAQEVKQMIRRVLLQDQDHGRVKGGLGGGGRGLQQSKRRIHTRTYRGIIKIVRIEPEVEPKKGEVHDLTVIP